MRRREFVAGVVATAGLPSAVRAQLIQPARRVDILFAEAIEDDPYYEGRLAALKERLHDLGWIEGQNLKLNIHRTAPKAVDIRKKSRRDTRRKTRRHSYIWRYYYRPTSAGNQDGSDSVHGGR